MTYVSLSPKFQVVIPKEVRNRLKLLPKQKFSVIEKGGVIYLIPEIPLKKMKGFFQGKSLDTSPLREKTDRL
ncbi:MAG: AbrB/MazE/SpoVT family DNA-binding domain-containing protein [Deltaproteobacteria bacterium]|nr:AbrB/MazE/SpoVT family DNA-binding domain-containing protein [Deltaproteobacteria bacterium]